MAAPQFSPGPVIGSGGYLGAAGQGWLEMNFASVGAYILTISLILGGILLSTDYVLLRILAWIFGKPTQNLGRGVMQAGAACAKRIGRKRRSDLDGFEEEVAEVPWQSASPAAAPRRLEDEDDADDAPDEGEEAIAAETEEKSAGGKSARRPLASLLRIAKPRSPDPKEMLPRSKTPSTTVRPITNCPRSISCCQARRFVLTSRRKRFAARQRSWKRHFSTSGFTSASSRFRLAL